MFVGRCVGVFSYCDKAVQLSASSPYASVPVPIHSIYTANPRAENYASFYSELI